ncbi:hypothetical protein FQA39_LY06819 [Lamprigera yunnana]|nr:hypothetical protein FQA39_LY06819 [Lamprigera yunnana]
MLSMCFKSTKDGADLSPYADIDQSVETESANLTIMDYIHEFQESNCNAIIENDGKEEEILITTTVTDINVANERMPQLLTEDITHNPKMVCIVAPHSLNIVEKFKTKQKKEADNIRSEPSVQNRKRAIAQIQRKPSIRIKVKMLRNKHLKLQAQQVIMNVLYYFERERDNGGACAPFTSVMYEKRSIRIGPYCIKQSSIFEDYNTNKPSKDYDPVFLDETWIFSRRSPKKSWHDNTLKSIKKKPMGEGKRFIVLNAGSIDTSHRSLRMGTCANTSVRRILLGKQRYNPEDHCVAEELLNYLEKLCSDDEDSDNMENCNKLQFVLFPPKDGSDSDVDDAPSDGEEMCSLRDIGHKHPNPSDDCS